MAGRYWFFGWLLFSLLTCAVPEVSAQEATPEPTPVKTYIWPAPTRTPVTLGSCDPALTPDPEVYDLEYAWNCSHCFPTATSSFATSIPPTAKVFATSTPPPPGPGTSVPSDPEPNPTITVTPTLAVTASPVITAPIFFLGDPIQIDIGSYGWTSQSTACSVGTSRETDPIGFQTAGKLYGLVYNRVAYDGLDTNSFCNIFKGMTAKDGDGLTGYGWQPYEWFMACPEHFYNDGGGDYTRCTDLIPFVEAELGVSGVAYRGEWQPFNGIFNPAYPEGQNVHFFLRYEWSGAQHARAAAQQWAVYPVYFGIPPDQPTPTPTPEAGLCSDGSSYLKDPEELEIGFFPSIWLLPGDCLVVIPALQDVKDAFDTLGINQPDFLEDWSGAQLCFTLVGIDQMNLFGVIINPINLLVASLVIGLLRIYLLRA